MSCDSAQAKRCLTLHRGLDHMQQHSFSLLANICFSHGAYSTNVCKGATLLKTPKVFSSKLFLCIILSGISHSME